MTGLTLAIAIASGCARPDCGGVRGDRRPWDLSLTPDQRAATVELATVRGIAAEYAQKSASATVADSQFVDRTLLREHAFKYCQAILLEEIASRHGVRSSDLERFR